MSLHENPTPASRPPFLPHGRALRILYIDHHSALRDVARLSLQRLGHTLECVSDGIMAARALDADPSFDLVLAEHDLPGLGGLPLVTRLRSRGYAGKIAILCSTLEPETESAYHDLGVDLILFKPVTPVALRECLAKLFPGSGRVG